MSLTLEESIERDDPTQYIYRVQLLEEDKHEGTRGKRGGGGSSVVGHGASAALSVNGPGGSGTDQDAASVDGGVGGGMYSPDDTDNMSESTVDMGIAGGADPDRGGLSASATPKRQSRRPPTVSTNGSSAGTGDHPVRSGPTKTTWGGSLMEVRCGVISYVLAIFVAANFPP